MKVDGLTLWAVHKIGLVIMSLILREGVPSTSRQRRKRRNQKRRTGRVSEVGQTSRQNTLQRATPVAPKRKFARVGRIPMNIFGRFERFIAAIMHPWTGAGVRFPSRRPTSCAQAVLHDSIAVLPVVAATNVSFAMFPHSRRSYAITQSFDFPPDGSAVNFNFKVKSNTVDAVGSPGAVECASLTAGLAPVVVFSSSIQGQIAFPIAFTTGITFDVSCDINSDKEGERKGDSGGTFKIYGYNTVALAWQQILSGVIPNTTAFVQNAVTLTANYNGIYISYSKPSPVGTIIPLKLAMNFQVHNPPPNTILVHGTELTFPLFATDYLQTPLVNQFRVTAMSLLVRNTTDASHESGNIAIARTNRGWNPDGVRSLYSNIEALPKERSGVYNLKDGAFVWWFPDSQREEEFRSEDLPLTDMSFLVANVQLAIGASCAFDYHFAIEFETTAQIFSQEETPGWSDQWEQVIRNIGKTPCTSENPLHMQMVKDFVSKMARGAVSGAKFVASHPELVEAGMAALGL